MAADPSPPRAPDDAVGEVAYAVGFSNPLSFSRAFTRRFGVAPTASRNRARGGIDGGVPCLGDPASLRGGSCRYQRLIPPRSARPVGARKIQPL